MRWVGRRLKREGIYVYIKLIHFVVQQKPTQHHKVSILQFKKKSFRTTYTQACTCVQTQNPNKVYSLVNSIILVSVSWF